MLAIVDALLPREPAVLLGPSLAGYLSTLAAVRAPERVRALVLFAPAFGFAQRWAERVGPAAMDRWRERRTAPVFHHGVGREVPLAIDLLEDAGRYPAEPQPAAPTLVFAGRHDDAVPLDTVERFARARPGRELVVLDSRHELTDVLEPMWERTAAFLQPLGVL
jgi:pimeloyl-ACP methyl ester carboxylesterase